MTTETTTRDQVEHILKMSLQKAGGSFYNQPENVQDLLVVAFHEGKIAGIKEAQEIYNK